MSRMRRGKPRLAAGHSPPEGRPEAGPPSDGAEAVRLRPWQGAVLLLGLALCCYWPALPGGFIWDDAAHVTRPDLQTVGGLVRIWTDLHATQQYYPLLHSAFWVEHQLWGDATLGYHVVNILWHTLDAGLLILLLRRLRIPGAVWAGLLFLVHPVCVESVAWISEQKNTLSLAFYLASALAYLRFDDLREAPAGRGGAARRAYGLALGCFLLALLTKSVTATLPAALLVIVWWRRGRLSWRRDGKVLLPWFALAVASGLFTAWVERRYNGAVGPEFVLTFPQRCLLAGRIVWFYVAKLVWPAHLVFVYPRWDVPASAATWPGYLAALVLVTAALAGWRRFGRGPLAAWLFFVGSLFPALGFFNVYPFLYSYVADHFQYLASLGLFTLAAAGAAVLMARCPPRLRLAGRLAGGALLATLVFLSQAQSRNYRDVTALYSATIADNPSCFLAHNNLGIVYERTGNPGAAEAEYRAAIADKPDLAEAHYNLGHLCLQLPGRTADAVREFEEAIRLKADYAEAHDNLANALAQGEGRLDEAIEQYHAALRARPFYPEAHFNLASVLDYQGRTTEAVAEFHAALQERPDYFEAHLSLGRALGKLPGRDEDAIAQYQAALRLRPDLAEPHLDLAVALLKVSGRTADAVAQLQEALQIQPNLEAARRLLAVAQAAQP